MHKLKFCTILFGLAFGASQYASAAIVSTINWTGQLTIDGFSSLPGLDADGNPTTMTLRYDIADGSSHNIGATDGTETVSGSIVIKDLLGPGNDFSLNPSLVSHIAEHATVLLPVGDVTFPPGVSPEINQTGNPIVTANVQNAGTGINSDLDITRDFFSGNIFEEDITEVAALGPNSLSRAFNAFDIQFGNSDGIISRSFDLSIELSNDQATGGDSGAAVVPIPGAVWLFMSGLAGVMVSRKKS